jgi:hypothetical protein
VPDDPSAFTRWVVEHPVRWGFVAGLALYFTAVILNDLPRLIWLMPAVVFGVANWWVWRRDGPAHKWRVYILRRFPKRER